MRGIFTMCLINLKVVHSYNKNKYLFEKHFSLKGKGCSLNLIPFRTDFIMRGIYASARTFDCLCM